MALPARQQVTYWGLAAVVFLILLWYLGEVMLPFIVGGAIAYILDPLADRLEALGLPRVGATAIITLVGLLGLLLAVGIIIPSLIRQGTALAQAAPGLFEALRDWLTIRFPDIMEEEGLLRRGLTDLGEMARERGGVLARQLVAGVFGVVNALVFIVVVPVVAFYMLLDWDRMVARIDELLPREHVGTIRRLASEIDRTLASFVRGQLTVCLILGTFYSVGLMLVGLQFGLVVGAIAGLITFIPYVGALVGGGLAIGLALFQFWGEWTSIGLVAAIFAAGQFLEGNILTPKLVGESVGLHPVWLLFALSAFGTIYGFVGMLVAVPVAAALGVLARFLVSEYKASRLYTGANPDDGPPPPTVADPGPEEQTEARHDAAE
ncbi:AI-2E family transporter [Jannaschia aquimarina]|uniref:Pheromone autoinducer 2 transporter n=1 Tax=Jannaschia aquimarina TaxID=935700 RepID=A0A0D1CTQ5_9RHOB|nr:AI-2E family transporter [Jannaschia aquimarina]KIT18157.1 pheromone autoinducer 2 transporter [Jannaschia aquimarina]SNT30627.1 Predicted PurR-regulated permease PerM [Jannaschia aquimarina]